MNKKSVAIFFSQNTDLKLPSLPWGLGFRLFGFLPTTFFEITVYPVNNSILRLNNRGQKDKR